jgi:hypothetical protein
MGRPAASYRAVRRGRARKLARAIVRRAKAEKKAEPEPEPMTLDQFRSLSACVEAENILGEAPAVFVFQPLVGVSKELVDLGYLIALDRSFGIVDLSVTPAGRLAVAQ